MTLVEEIRAGRVPDAVRSVAASEAVDRGLLLAHVAAGRVVIPRNKRRPIAPQGVGAGLCTKVNANLGTSSKRACLEEERQKLATALEAGAHAVMDLSTAGPLDEIRRTLIDECPVMLGTVPVYGMVAALEADGRAFASLTVDELYAHIAAQCESGVDYITVHAGTTREALRALASTPRVLGIVSRGGALMAEWMTENHAENPLYEHFDRLLELAHEYDVTLSLGDSLRPGSVVDATDAGQLAELLVLAELARRARRAGVQVIIEGPGHVPLPQIAEHVRLQKRLCDGAPFYLLGPLVTDSAAGHDHIAAAIGGAVAAGAGADFLCYVTPAEHLRLPDLADVRAGVIAARIAAHAGDLAKGQPAALERDRRMSAARARLDWEGMFALCIDPAGAREKRRDSEATTDAACTMCGSLCAVERYNRLLPSLEAGR